MVEEFLGNINGTFTKYAEEFTKLGIESPEDISELNDDDYKSMEIPLFHYRKILNGARSKFSGAGAGEQKEGNPVPNAVTSSTTTGGGSSKVDDWGTDEVALYISTLSNGELAEYAPIFEEKNIDGPKFLSFKHAKDLNSIIPELGARYQCYEGVTALKSGNVPSIPSLLKKRKMLEGTSPKMEHKPSNIKEENSNLVAVETKDTSVRARLIKFYEIYNPEKLGNESAIDELLKRYQGREKALFADLEKKYILGQPKVVGKKKQKELTDTRDEKTDAIMRTLWQLYNKHIRNIEELYKFPEFHTPLLDEVDFLAAPMVLLVGQYSVGKTSFIRYMVGRDFPGIRVGPEPTTDAFGAIMWGKEERLIPGHTVPMDITKPFRSLQNFGAGFLNKFAAAEVPSPLLESITFIDTPGILAGSKHRLGRNYDFSKVVEWFAYRSDRILLLFDAHKLDISDEFKSSIEMLKGHDDKIRCILNKADAVTNQQLLRVYGALMWSLGKVFKTPEVLRVYVSSFWDEEYKNSHNSELFDSESTDLISDLRQLPRHASTRRINEFVKRTRQMKVHALIIEHLRSQFGWFGKDKKQKNLLDNLRDQFKEIAKNKKLNLNDFPNPEKFRKLVQKHDLSKFPKFKQKWIDGFDHVLNNEVPILMQKLPSASGSSGDNKDDDYGNSANPFDNINDTGIAQGDISKKWAISGSQKQKFDVQFYQMKLQQGKASGHQVMAIMMKSGLTRDVLKKIWDLSDIDNDGKMDDCEFALAMYLIDHINSGNKLMPTLPIALVPPTKRHLMEFNTA